MNPAWKPRARARKPLSTLQKRTLVILARQAWDRQRLSNDGTQTLDDWRAEQSIAACGSRISAASNDDYNLIKAHFLNLAGCAGAAFEATMRSGNEGQRRARHNLEAACIKAGLDEGYADAICRAEFKVGLDDASAAQLERLMFTVAARGRAHRRRDGAVVANAVTNGWEGHAEK